MYTLPSCGWKLNGVQVKIWFKETINFLVYFENMHANIDLELSNTTGIE